MYENMCIKGAKGKDKKTVLKAFMFVAGVGIALTASADAASAGWERPRTTRRYLHPPMVDCMYTIWNDGKVMRGENRHQHDWKIGFHELMADVMWVFHGEDEKPFDFKASENRLPENGIPFHSLTWREGGLVTEMDAFCEVGPRSPSCFIRLTVRNEGDKAVREPYAVYLRRMQERNVVKGAPDIYIPYESQPEPFLYAPLFTYKMVATNVWASETVAVRAEGLPEDSEWDGLKCAVRFTVALEPGQSLSADFVMGANDAVARISDRDVARERAKEFWEGELAKINRLPQKIRNDPKKFRLVQNLTVQMLQCFCHPIGSDLVIPRQGGLQRYVWPWDCREMLTALGMVGDFGEYVEAALDLYFREYAMDDGRIGPFRHDWVCNTAECLHTLARYCLDTDNAAVWKRHRDAAMRGFDWMREKRATSSKDGKSMPGFFPISWATDNPTPIQLWGFTDRENLYALMAFSEAARHFGDPRADEVDSERADLVKVFAETYRKFSKAAEGKDELRIPLTPDGNDDAFRKSGYFDTGQGHVLLLGLMNGFAPDEDVIKVYNWHLRNGRASPNGLCSLTPPRSDKGNRHYWYTTASERAWHRCFLRIGRKDLADLVFNAIMKYSITTEYYVGERYRDDTPWYYPWSPNASGNGRIIQMLFAHCGIGDQ